MAYMEHVGSKRQFAPKKGEINLRYNFITEIKKYLNKITLSQNEIKDDFLMIPQMHFPKFNLYFIRFFN